MSFLLIRPDSWNFPLFLHVAGAMLVTASLVVAVAALFVAWRADGHDRAAITRFAFRTLLIAGIPSYFLMHGAAEWIVSRENIPSENEPGWVGLGYGMADIGGIVMLLATILAWLGARRLRSGGGGAGLAKAATLLATLVVAMFVVAIWAMTTKPS
jgi:uncharacterized membrane protein YkgB